MRVLILSHMFPNCLDGSAGIFVLEQAKALREAGVTVHIVSPTPWAPRQLGFLSSVRKYGVIPMQSTVAGFVVDHPRVPTLPKNVGFAWTGILFYLSCRRLVGQLVRELAIDVIHAHTILPDGFAAALLGREFGLPTVCTAHGSDVNVYPRRYRFARHASRWSLRHADRMVTVSESLKDEALALAGPRDISVVHNGADTEIFKHRPKNEARSQLNLNATARLITFVGYLRPEKGLHVLLQAFARLGRPETRMCIVGDGPLRDSLTVQARELGVLDRCLFVGKQPHEEIPKWIAGSDCIVLPSLSEGLPTILPEAMLCGIPVIATPVGGIPEVIRDRETGLIVPCCDPVSLATALEKLLSDEALTSEIANRAQNFAQRCLTWAGNARAMLDIYNDAARNSASRAAVHHTLRSSSVH